MSDEANNTAETVEAMSRMGRGTKNVAEPSENEKIITPEYQMKHNHLLVIAVDRYDDKEIPNLKNCLNDVEDLLEVLTKHYFFNRDNVRFLRSREATDEQAQEEIDAREISYAALVGEATHDNIIAQLKKLAKILTPEDNLIICFSGHGIYDEDFDEGYWIPSDGRLDYNSSYIENGTIRTALNAIKTHHTVLISDSCYSGTLFAGGQTRSLTVPRIYFQPSRWGITAGRKEPVSDGTLGDNSPFAKELLDILRQKREIWIADLINEIIRRVTDENNEKQSPVGEALSFIKGHQNGQFVFLPRLATEEDYWIMAWQENTRKGYYAFLARYPNGRYEETALDALNVFANNANQNPAFNEEALATYQLLLQYLPEEAKSYARSFLNGETRSVLRQEVREMYHDLMKYFSDHIERELKAFVLLGENVSSQDKLLKEYERLKGNEERLKKNFERAFIKDAKGNPYRGLNPYSVWDSPFFFGRKAATYKIIDQLNYKKLVIISAPVYAGKTSLVLAGVYPALKEQDDSYELYRLPINVEDSNDQHRSQIIHRIKKDKKQLLFIDAFEQLFAQSVSETERVSYQKDLIAVLEQDFPHLRTVICIRSAAEKHLRSSSFLLADKLLNPLEEYLYRLPNMNENELSKVLLGPMWNSSVEYESTELVDKIIKDVEHVPNVLPILSFSLQELYNNATKEGNVVSKKHYVLSGGVHATIDSMADRAYFKDKSAEELRGLKKIFLRMVEPLGNGQYQGRAVGRNEFTHPNPVEKDWIRKMIRFFTHHNYTSLVEVSAYASVIGALIPSNLLVTNWSRLQQWIIDFKDENIVLQRELEAIARINNFRHDNNNLWDNDPRLKRVLNHIMEESHPLIKNDNPDFLARLAEIAASLEVKDQALFSDFIDQWKASDLPPALDDAILSGASYKLLEALLQTPTHWLSIEESQFILKSWDKKVQAFMALKKERDEALAAKKQAEMLLRKSVIQTQSFKAKYQEQTYKDLLFMQQGFKPNLHLILVGIDDYPKRSRLTGCVADVEAIAVAFGTQEGKLYDKVFSHVLTNENATKEHILKKITAVKENAGVLDFVFIYLAGHSIQVPYGNAKNEDDGGLITYSDDYKEGEDIRQFVHLVPGEPTRREDYNHTLILSGQELCTALLQFKCKVILTLDISYGGEFLSALIAANHSDKPEHLSNYVFALSGSSTKEQSSETYIDGKPRGVFSYALTNSITTNEADLDGNGVLYLDELLRYTSKVVKEKLKNQNVLAVVPPIMTNIPLFQLGDNFALPTEELVLSGHITDDAVIRSINTIFGIEENR